MRAIATRRVGLTRLVTLAILLCLYLLFAYLEKEAPSASGLRAGGLSTPVVEHPDTVP